MGSGSLPVVSPVQDRRLRGPISWQGSARRAFVLHPNSFGSNALGPLAVRPLESSEPYRNLLHQPAQMSRREAGSAGISPTNARRPGPPVLWGISEPKGAVSFDLLGCQFRAATVGVTRGIGRSSERRSEPGPNGQSLQAILTGTGPRWGMGSESNRPTSPPNYNRSGGVS